MSSTPPTLTSSECPNCGATIDLSKVADDQTQIECEYCGSMLNLPRREKLHEIQAQTIVIHVSEPEVAAVPAQPKKPGGAGCGCIIPILVLGILVVVFWQFGMFDALVSSKGAVPGLPNLPKIVVGARAFGDPLPLPRADDGPQEVAYLTLADKATRVVSVNMAKQVENWRSQEFSDRFTDIAMQADADHVYVADGDALVALNRANGEPAWTMTLPYAISTDHECRYNACLRVFGNTVVARLKDGTLQAVDSETGKPAWSKQLSYTSGGVYDALGNPAVVDTADGKNSDASFIILDRNSGETASEIAPDCVPDRSTSRLRAEYPFASDDWLISPDGKSLIVVKDGSAPCAWKYDLATGKEDWQYNPGRDGDSAGKLPFMSQDPTLLSSDGVFVSDVGSDAQMNKLDMQSGDFSVLFTDKRHRFEPLLAHAGMVYVIATPNFDNNKRELWAFDAATGQKRWQIALKTSHGFDKWVLQPSDAGLFFMQTLWDDGKVLFDVLDPQTGAYKSRQVLEVDNPSLSGEAYESNTAWINLSTKLHEVDMNTGAVKATWP